MTTTIFSPRTAPVQAIADHRRAIANLETTVAELDDLQTKNATGDAIALAECRLSTCEKAESAAVVELLGHMVSKAGNDIDRAIELYSREQVDLGEDQSVFAAMALLPLPELAPGLANEALWVLGAWYRGELVECDMQMLIDRHEAAARAVIDGDFSPAAADRESTAFESLLAHKPADIVELQLRSGYLADNNYLTRISDDAEAGTWLFSLLSSLA